MNAPPGIEPITTDKVTAIAPITMDDTSARWIADELYVALTTGDNTELAEAVGEAFPANRDPILIALGSFAVGAVGWCEGRSNVIGLLDKVLADIDGNISMTPSNLIFDGAIAEEAWRWAVCRSTREQVAFGFACFNALPPDAKVEFLAALNSKNKNAEAH